MFFFGLRFLFVNVSPFVFLFDRCYLFFCLFDGLPFYLFEGFSWFVVGWRFFFSAVLSNLFGLLLYIFLGLF